MTDIQKSLLELLKEIDGICKKYQIDYYLGGGTQIGAIRHGKFLPWDDDADVHMTRENAWRFVEALKAEKLPNRVVYTGEEDGSNTLAHWRYLNTSSTALLRGLVGTSDPQGQFVDILVFYPLPSNEKEKVKQVDAFRMYCELKNDNGICRAFMPKSFYQKVLFFLKAEKYIGRKRILRYWEKKAFEHPKDNTEKWFVRSSRVTKEEMVRDIWGTPRYVPFEDTMLPVAEHVELQESLFYGTTWFEVPAYEERGAHVFVTDMEIPYSVYIEDQKKRFDARRFYEKEKDKKKYWLSVLPERNEVVPQLGALQGVCTALELQNTIQTNRINLQQLVEEGREKELQDLFTPYFNRIRSQRFKYYGLYLDMPDEYLYAAFYFQCFNGNYGVAKRVLGQRRTRVKRGLSSELQRLCNICDATDELLIALYGELDLQKAREIVDEWLPKEPTALYFQRADIYLCLSGFGAETDADLLRRCDRYLEQYPDDGELLKYRGDLLLRLGQSEDGERCYRKALCSLRNGFCIRAIKEYFHERHQLEVIQ